MAQQAHFKNPPQYASLIENGRCGTSMAQQAHFKNPPQYASPIENGRCGISVAQQAHYKNPPQYASPIENGRCGISMAQQAHFKNPPQHASPIENGRCGTSVAQQAHFKNPPQHITPIENGRCGVSVEMLRRLCISFNVSGDCINRFLIPRNVCGMRTPPVIGNRPADAGATVMAPRCQLHASLQIIPVLQPAAHRDVQGDVLAAAAVGALHLFGVAQG